MQKKRHSVDFLCLFYKVSLFIVFCINDLTGGSAYSPQT